jgi:hypothetical protein
VADVTHPLIGADFLSYYCLMVDCKNNRILDGVTSLSTSTQAATLLILSIKVTSGGTPFDNLLSDFADLTCPTGVQREVRHNTVHHIRTTPGPSVGCHVAVRYSSPLRKFLVPRTILRFQKGQRLTIVWRLQITQRRDHPCYPVRHIHDYFHQLFGCSYSSIDLVRACSAIPVHPDDIQETAITTPFGLFDSPSWPSAYTVPHRHFIVSWRHSTGTRFLFCLFG